MADFKDAETLTKDLTSIIQAAINDIDQNKIDLTTSDKEAIRETLFTSFNPSAYIINEDEFLRALDETQHWAESYADGFVGLKHFIYSVLNDRRGFSIGPSSSLVNILIEKGTVELFEVKSAETEFPVKAIRRKKDSKK